MKGESALGGTFVVVVVVISNIIILIFVAVMGTVGNCRWKA